MIDVVFKRSNKNLVFAKICGHADFDEYNKDIVCSAASVISQTILIGLVEVLKQKPIYSIKDGFMEISLENLTGKEISEAQVLMETMLLGFTSMNLNYGDYINVKVEEV